ncbi:MAG: DUF4159 domain-containing protein [Amaricoccus sp.]|uniref:DUF4159 domain-containing protein n=1 Tax=Amaricoccus sp. TaxID=1872485 RepID=UPI0039E3BF6F
MIGSVAFLSPWLLAGLAVLPVLWWLLRAVPPAPGRRAFPGVRLLLGLKDLEKMPERTPWWLLLLRMLALAAAILAFAGPVLNPRPVGSSDPLLVLMDGGWGDAPEWNRRVDRVAAALDEAARDGRRVAVLEAAAPPQPAEDIEWRAASEWAERLPGLAPKGWAPDRAALAAWIGGRVGRFETLWLTDGIADGGEGPLAQALLAHGPVTLVRPPQLAVALTPPRLEGGEMIVTALRAQSGAARPVGVVALGPDPNGVERALGGADGSFAAGADRVDLKIDMPVELRNRIGRVQLGDGRSAAGVVLADDSVRRRKVGLVSGRAGSEAQELVDPLHYLRAALEPFAEVIEAPLGEMLNAAPDVLILADVGSLGEAERAELLPWVEKGGLLVRFAGPRLAQSGVGQLDEDPLLPVRLRAGGRSIGGAMSWGAPRKLKPFPDTSPFAGLALPGDVDISSQVMAQPDPDLPSRVMASLEDGTPLVTGKPVGDGRVVLFHVTASPDWSSLPLSGLFVQMLERLTQSAGGLATAPETLAGVMWTPQQVLDGFGELGSPGLVAGVPGERLAEAHPSPETPPGIYASGDRRVALNVMRADSALAPLAALPQGVVTETMDRPEEIRLGPWLIALALLFLAADVIATLVVSGRLGRRFQYARAAAGAGALVLAVGLAAALAPGRAEAQAGPSDAEAIHAATQTVLAYVATGDPRVDAVSAAGLKGLSKVLYDRTAIEPADPVAVDIEAHDISLYPFLYWPITESQPPPSDAAVARVNEFFRSGGMILFDTQDADLGGAGAVTPSRRALQRIAARLDIPPLEPVPSDHVLTRTFYLLHDFPGRWANSTVWVEASPAAQPVDGMPFRNLNDGVTPVVIGGNDWAAAWAINDGGAPMFPVGRGLAGENQREMALRFGVNLIMYVMTGNYKSDQVHVPALLDRLGQ